MLYCNSIQELFNLFTACRSAGCVREALALASAQLLPEDPLLATLRAEYAASTAAGDLWLSLGLCVSHANDGFGK
jgi:hypothetical protein